MAYPKSINLVQAALVKGEFTLSELLDHHLKQIEANKDLNAFLEVFEDSAKETANRIQQKISKGAHGKLAGLILGIKDNIAYTGHEMTASSKILESYHSPYNATVIERLLAEDAIIIGRLNCDEFAMGSSNENSAFGPVKNPLDKERVSGGSSGGSAASVADGMCMAALGSDTGGSIRQPASFCGVVGLKPTYGRVSRYGLIAYASSMDQIGTFTNNAEDAGLILEVMAGKDGKDSTMSDHTVKKYADLGNKDKKYEIAYYKEIVDSEGLDPKLKKDFLDLIEQLRAGGHRVEEMSFEYLKHLVPTYNVLSNAEASSNLSRFDGIRYGYRSENAHDIDSTYVKSRSEGFGPEVKRRIMLGTFVLSAGYYDAYYARAQKVRRLIQKATETTLREYDFIISPTTPHAAFKIGEIADPVQMYLEDIFTVQANLSGMPGISIPYFESDKGLPIGLQVVAGKFEEKALLEFCDRMIRQTSEIST